MGCKSKTIFLALFERTLKSQSWNKWYGCLFVVVSFSVCFRTFLESNLRVEFFLVSRWSILIPPESLSDWPHFARISLQQPHLDSLTLLHAVRACQRCLNTHLIMNASLIQRTLQNLVPNHPVTFVLLFISQITVQDSCLICYWHPNHSNTSGGLLFNCSIPASCYVFNRNFRFSLMYHESHSCQSFWWMDLRGGISVTQCDLPSFLNFIQDLTK